MLVLPTKLEMMIKYTYKLLAQQVKEDAVVVTVGKNNGVRGLLLL